MCRIYFLFATCFSFVTSICAQLIISESQALSPDTLSGPQNTINMTAGVFHIGRTSVYEYTGVNYKIISCGVRDVFGPKFSI